MNPKEEVLRIIQSALENGEPFIILARGDDNSAAAMGGNLKELTMMIVRAMDAEPRLREPFELAIKYLDTKQDHAEAERDCSTCEEKDDCPIYNLGKMDIADVPVDVADLLQGIMKDKGYQA